MGQSTGVASLSLHSDPRGGVSAHLLPFPVQDSTCRWWPYIPKPILPGVEALCSFLYRQWRNSIGFFLSFLVITEFMKMDVHVTHYSYICIAAVEIHETLRSLFFFLSSSPFLPGIVFLLMMIYFFVLTFHVLLLKVMFLCDYRARDVKVFGWFCTLKYCGAFCAALD